MQCLHCVGGVLGECAVSALCGWSARGEHTRAVLLGIHVLYMY